MKLFVRIFIAIAAIWLAFIVMVNWQHLAVQLIVAVLVGIAVWMAWPTWSRRLTRRFEQWEVARQRAETQRRLQYHQAAVAAAAAAGSPVDPAAVPVGLYMPAPASSIKLIVMTLVGLVIGLLLGGAAWFGVRLIPVTSDLVAAKMIFAGIVGVIVALIGLLTGFMAGRR